MGGSSWQNLRHVVATPITSPFNGALSSEMSTKGPLIVRLCNWVGEAILSLPSLTLLSEQGYELHLIGKPWAVNLFAGHGWRVHVRPGKRKQAIAQLKALRHELARQTPAFNQRPNMVLFTNSFSSAMEARLAGLKPVGYNRDGRRFLLAHGIPYQNCPHAADSYWRIVSHFSSVSASVIRPSALGLIPSQEQRAHAQHLVDYHQLGCDFVILCPFSGAADTTGKKLWLAFPELAQKLAKNGRRVVLCPGPDEAHEAHQEYPMATILGDVDLGTYAALSQMASCTISNDTGPGHLAAAAGSKVLSVFGPGSTPHWTPVGPGVTVLHPSEGWPTVQEVLCAVESLAH